MSSGAGLVAVAVSTKGENLGYQFYRLFYCQKPILLLFFGHHMVIMHLNCSLDAPYVHINMFFYFDQHCSYANHYADAWIYDVTIFSVYLSTIL